MAKIKVTLDTRSTSKDKVGKFPLVLRISHKRKTRDIHFDIHLLKSQFSEETKAIRGIENSVRRSKKVQKIFSEIDLWMDDKKSEIKLWEITTLKNEIERRFFKKQNELSLLIHGGKYLHRLVAEERFSTAISYEDALKVFVKYQIKTAKKNDKIIIKSLYDKLTDEFTLKEEYKKYDLPIKAITTEFSKNFKAYLSQRMNSKNSVGIVLRSIQAIMNDAGGSFPELMDHRPMARIKKGSFKNAPNPLTIEEVNNIRKVKVVTDSSEFHVKNYFLFMFGNMGMNFVDMALLKRFQFEGERIKYFRKKTAYEGDYFSVKQSEECLSILQYYVDNQSPDDYIFPILEHDLPPSRIHRVKNDRLGWFNKHLRRLAKKAAIQKDITSYSARDTWTNIGLDMGIDIRKISAGLGHSSIEVTNKHYGASIQEKILDEINSRITG